MTDEDTLAAIARRHGFGAEAVAAMLRAVQAGGGGMAQFSHPEFGGAGQWMRGGMTMVGEMFNDALKARVAALCAELATLPAAPPSFARPWWPDGLGAPASTGGQNDIRYAYFPAARRLVVDRAGRVTVYDTQDHPIAGVSQQQPGRAGLVFTSQHGTVDLAMLPVVG